jgi:HEPN domain-containing protein
MKNREFVSEERQKAISLTDYAVKTRYPGESESVTQEEYEEALMIAENLCKWVSSIIKGNEE